MTYEELRIEAERQGYKLTKINRKTEPLKPCICGHNKRDNIPCSSTYKIICKKCGFSAEGTDYWDARVNWNKKVS